MTDPNKANHWDDLASTLGATPSADDAALRQSGPPPSQPRSPAKPAARASRQRAAPTRSADWDVLASDLGLAPAPPPKASPPAAPPAVAAPRSTTVPSSTVSSLPEQGERDVPPPRAPEESPNFFDERFDPEEPFDLLESSESSSAASETAGEAAVEPTESRPRKRRRRRRSRGRGSDQREPPAADAPTTADDRSGETVSASAEDLVCEFVADEGGAAAPKQSHDQANADESQERHPKRRRSRRGRKRRSDTEATAGVADKVADSGGPSADAGSQDSEAIEDEVLDDVALELGEGDEGDEERPVRLGFRGIPTWDEAVGLLIDKNIEARAKRPAAGGPQRGRGNRGGRDNRGRGGKPRS
jgi:hypothetical protein